jgi:carbon monoxide dehydrogenase subunit G
MVRRGDGDRAREDVGWMARYLTSVPTAWSPKAAFDFMADVRNFARWDPGVESVSAVAGDGPGLGASYDVVVRAGLRRLVLRYEVKEWDAPHRLLLVAETVLLQSVDEIKVEPADGGSVVTYDARLNLRGMLSLGDPLLGLAFRRIGDRAAAGLRRVLGGEPSVTS